jgi:hypothetical protein
VSGGLVRAAAPEEAGARPERDDAHADAGHDLLRAVERVAVDVEVVAADADDQGDGGVGSDVMRSSFRIVIV